MYKHYICQILAVGLLWSSNAVADVVWSGEQNLYVPYNYERQLIDLNSDSLTDALLLHYLVSPDVYPPIGTNGVLRAYADDSRIDGSNQILAAVSDGQDVALPYGTLISGTPDASLEWKSGRDASGLVSSWSTTIPEPDTEWNGLLGQTGEAYVGIAFDVGESTHYGWIRVALGEVDPFTGFKSPILSSWAYESTPDTPIIAGAIPEPSTGILTLVGSLGLLLVARSRRRENKPILPRLPGASTPPDKW